MIEVKLDPGSKVYLIPIDADSPSDGIYVGYDVDRDGKFVVNTILPDDVGRSGTVYEATFEDRKPVRKTTRTNRRSGGKILTCNRCGSEFELSDSEIDHLVQIFGDDYREPTHCYVCRKEKKKQKLEMKNVVEECANE